MKLRPLLCVLIAAVYGEYPLEKCKRPNGDEGLCMRYDRCPEIVETSGRESSRIVKEYACGSDGDTTKICCKFNCYTPEGNLGQCRPVSTCPHLFDMMNSKNKDSKDYVRDSRCLTDGKDLCCGPRPEADYTEPKEFCSEYATAFPPHPKTLCCGIDALTFRKSTGAKSTATEIDAYPWLALLEYKRKDTGEIKTYCGGALISARYVVTAAHCIKGNGAWPPINVRLGEYNIASDYDCVEDDCADPVSRIPIDEIIIHPKYDPSTNQYDIALIRLSTQAMYTDFVRPICLPASNILRNDTSYMETYVAGWGKKYENRTRSLIKQHNKVPIVNPKVCKRVYRSWLGTAAPNISSNPLCAGGERGKESCSVDSGGPLMLKTSSAFGGTRFDLIGVYSFGYKMCDTEDLPRIYTNVYKYSTWIRRSILP